MKARSSFRRERLSYKSNCFALAWYESKIRKVGVLQSAGTGQSVKSCPARGGLSLAGSALFSIALRHIEGSDMLERHISLQLEIRDDGKKTVEASLSSETPILRPGLGREILVHTSAAVDLSRAPLPLLTSHNRDETPVGIIENIRISSGKLRATLRFGNSQRALEAWEDVKAGVLRSISIGYQILKGESRGEDYVVTSWMPFEASLVSVPADPTVGIGRSYQGNQIMETQTQNEVSLSRTQRKAATRTAQETTEALNDIYAIGQQFKVGTEKTRNFIDEHGADSDGFRAFVLTSLRDTGAMRTSESIELGLSKRDLKEYSFVKLIMAQADPTRQRDAGLEMEASRAMAKKLGRDPQGLFVPNEVLIAQRDLLVGTPSMGGNLRPTQHLGEGFIDVLRNRCHIVNLGATQMNDLQGNLAIPVKAGTSTAYWVTEGNAPSESQQVFGQLAMAPKTVAGFTDYSRKMMLQSSPSIEQIVRVDLADTIAVELDRVAINGSGVGAEPLGILGTSCVGLVAAGTNGAVPTWDMMLALEESLAVSNADASTIAYLTNAKVRRKLKGTTKAASDAGAGYIWEALAGGEPGWGMVNGYRAAATNNCPNNLTKGTSSGVCSAMILGNWEDMLIGIWGGLDILVDPYANATSGGFRVIALLDCDIGVRRASSFAVIKDLLTT